MSAFSRLYVTRPSSRPSPRILHPWPGDRFRSLIRTLRPRDVLVADALYCNYFLIALLRRAGVDVLFEQHGSRITDFRLGARDPASVTRCP